MEERSSQENRTDQKPLDWDDPSLDEAKRQNEPLELKYKLFFFFVPIIFITSIVGAHFKAQGYLIKERDKWRFIVAGFGFYALIAVLYVRFFLRG